MLLLLYYKHVNNEGLTILRGNVAFSRTFLEEKWTLGSCKKNREGNQFA